ncbi:MAG TPA: sterol desaturase family protein [Candidatus Paceibacterota bacterium]|nr:sterol desaturase family protein [Candidatus Paceibacterota bacterium]
MREFCLALIVGLGVGSLGEYWVHRLMHAGKLYAVEHFAHHSLNAPQGWLREYWAYICASGLWLVAAGLAAYWFLGTPVAAGWLVGSFGFLAFSAYTHMLYHIDPNLVFWIRRPIHVFHHEWSARYNFGVTSTVWDRMFGTYKDEPKWQRKPVPLIRVFSVPWL